MRGVELAMERSTTTDSKAVVTRGEQFVVVEGRTVWFWYHSHSNERLPTDVSYNEDKRRIQITTAK